MFLDGEFHKVSADLLQMVCGHRAEVIQVKRDAILKNVKDPVAKIALNKIPPSNTHIFEADAFSSVLEKSGGVRKTFWPPKSENPQKGSSRAYRQPPRSTGAKNFRGPSNGPQMSYYTTGPSRPMYNHYPLSRGGNRNMTSDDHSNNSFRYNERGSFQDRGSKPRGSQRGGKGRATSSHAARSNSKHYEQ